MIVWWTVVAWLSGSCMFSYWLGRLARTNLKAVGDGNPGALNLWLAAGYKFGIAGIALDFLKGFIPVLLLMNNGVVEGYGIVPVALAPIVGHAFSPFLHFEGGKAIAVTFGVWSALTQFEVSLVFAIVLALLLLIGRMINKGKPVSTSADGFQVVCGLLLVFAYLYLREFPSAILWFWLGNFLLISYSHRRELSSFVMRS